jgi:hypothetical protein
MKKCTKCGQVKNFQSFYTSSARSKIAGHIVYFSWCKICHSEESSNNRKKRREKNSSNSEIFNSELKICFGCKIHKTRSRENWSIDRGNFDGLESYCRDCKSLKKRNKRSSTLDGDILDRIIHLVKRFRTHNRYGKLGWIDDSKDTWVKKLSDQNFRCALSGITLTSKNVSIDHINPISKGGTNDMLNLRLLDREVNLARRVMSDIEFLDLCEKVTTYNRR